LAHLVSTGEIRKDGFGMTFLEEYKSKLVSPQKAAQQVKSGDLVAYGHFGLFPAAFDKALGQRAGEDLVNVTIDVASSVRFPEVVKNDPDMKTFTYYSNHFNGIDRKLGDMNRVSYVPTSYHELQKIRRDADQPFDKKNVMCLMTCPMDKHGNFNFGIAASNTYATLKNADLIIVEVNEKNPYCMGGAMESINIKDVDYIIETDERIFTMPPAGEPSETEKQIAALIMPMIPNRACLQLGIGGVPNTIGALIAQSDIKDLGINTEMFCDAMVDMYEAGKITNKYKTRDVGRSSFTFCFGNEKTHQFLDHNPQVAAYDCDYTNNPKYIALEDNVISINNCIEVDLFSQVCSESNGIRQISGTGGSLDFHIGAWESKGGKGILAFNSTYTSKDGKVKSRINPCLPQGAIVSVPRVLVNYLVTEYGAVNMRGRSVWGMAEGMISIAHPDFRDDLIKIAKEMKLWSPTNRIPY
jgi:acyl-CoA hydrolase